MTTSHALEVRASERQLFLDTAGVAEIENLTHRMPCPQKKGTVIRGDYLKHPGCAIQTRSAPIWDPEKEVYKLWVMGVAPAPPHITVQGDFSGYYESKDGLNWYLPVVGEVDYGGSQENNFVTAKVSGRYARTDCVVYDKTDPDPGRRFKASIPDCWHGCDWHTECTGGFAVSPDGIHWTESSSPGIASYDEWGLSFDEREGLFIHYVKFSDPTFGYRSVYLSTSTDFETWTEPKLVFCADEQDQEVAPRRIAARLADKTRLTPEYNVPETYRAEVYHMNIFRYESHYIGVPAFSYHTGSVPKDWPGFDEMNLSPAVKELVHTHGDYTWFYELQLASSRDLYHWTRLGDRQPWLENSARRRRPRPADHHRTGRRRRARRRVVVLLHRREGIRLHYGGGEAGVRRLPARQGWHLPGGAAAGRLRFAGSGRNRGQCPHIAVRTERFAPIRKRGRPGRRAAGGSSRR